MYYLLEKYYKPMWVQYREGNGTPLEYSCLKNPMDAGARWAAVHGVAKSRTRLKRLSSSSSTSRMQYYIVSCVSLYLG